MSFVEDALKSQKSVWREIVSRIVQERLADGLPPQPPKRILLFGVGSSLVAAKLTGFSLSRETKLRDHRSWVPVVSCSSMAIGVEVIPGHEDWAIAFSHRGRSEVTQKALELCAKAGSYPVLIAAQGVEQESPAALVLHSSPLEKCEPHTVGLSGAICAATTLLSAGKMAPLWESLASQDDPNLGHLREKAAPPTLILGEWEGEWLAKEASLKLTEMAGLRVPVYGSEEFFHGPSVLSQSMTSSPDRIWHISVPQDLRVGKISPDERVFVSGGHSLSWMSALVHLQWLCLAVALNANRNPDGAKP